MISTIALISSCQKSNFSPLEQNTARKSPITVLGKTGGATCSCAPNYTNNSCPDPWIKGGLMAGQTTATYTMYWTNCSTTDAFSSNICNSGSVNNFTSQVTFCYGHPTGKGDSCVILMEVDSVPECVKCDVTHQSAYCVKLHAKCSSTNNKDWNVTLDDDDPNTPPLVKYNYTANRDDVTFQICCSKTIGNIVYTYCCSGYMVRNI